jgi:hypothetical protein
MDPWPCHGCGRLRLLGCLPAHLSLISASCDFDDYFADQIYSCHYVSFVCCVVYSFCGAVSFLPDEKPGNWKA